MSETGRLSACTHDGYGSTVDESVMALVTLLSMLEMRSQRLFSRLCAYLVHVVNLFLQSVSNFQGLHHNVKSL